MSTRQPAARKTPARKATPPRAAKKAVASSRGGIRDDTARAAKVKTAAKATAKAQPAAGDKPRVKPDGSADAKPHKPKLVRDSFTMPKSEYQVIDQLKQRSAALARPAKKSEILRAGIKALAAMDDAAFAAAVNAVPTIKTGRPKTKKAVEPTPLA